MVFFFRFVSVGLDGREQQQPQYQAPLSLSTHRIDRGGGCLHAAAAATAPAAAPAFVVERRESFFFVSLESDGYSFFSPFFCFFFPRLFCVFFSLLLTRIPTLAVGLGIKASRGVQMYSLHEGSSLFLLAVLAGLQVNLILKKNCSGVYAGHFFVLKGVMLLVWRWCSLNYELAFPPSSPPFHFTWGNGGRECRINSP